MRRLLVIIFLLSAFLFYSYAGQEEDKAKVVKEMFSMSLTFVLALWGTVLSTIVVTWNIYRGLQDRRKIRLGPFLEALEPEDAPELCLKIIITNIGRRPVYVKDLFIMTSSRFKTRLRFSSLPKMLKEGEYHIISIKDLSILTPNIEYIFVCDSAGKKWKIKKKEVKSIVSIINHSRKKDAIEASNG